MDMKKIIIVLSVLGLTVLLINSYNYIESDCEIPPHARGGRNFNVNQRMRAIASSAMFHEDDFVIVATPIEAIPTGFTRCGQFCETWIYYYVRVTNWLFGYAGEEIILVRSRSDEVFEVGREYTFTVRHVSNVLADQDFYDVTNLYCALDSQDVSPSELQIFHEQINQMTSNNNARREAIEEATPTSEIIESIDVAVIVTIIDAWNRTDIFNASINASVDFKDVAYGELDGNALDKYIILRGEVNVGDDYLILFRFDEWDNLRLLARQGAIIPYGSAEFYQFMELFESAPLE